MKKLITKLLIVLVALIGSGGVFAFDMNSIDVDCWGKDYLCDFTKSSDKLKFPVHETITLLAYDCYEKPDACGTGIANTSADTLKKSGRLRDLVLGSEWNDDPDSLLRQGVTEAMQWYALFKDAKLQAECKKQPGPKCKGKEIAQNPMMLYRSHFGDMQFIHSMASSNDEAAQITKEKMMAWAKFTYGIFIAGQNMGKQDINNKNISSFVDIAKNINKPGWTVGALFDPVPGGEWKKSSELLKFGRYEPSGKPRKQNEYENGKEKISVKYIALGSLLHMVQDSYSDSHTAREHGCNPLARSKGKIIAFRNYADQQGDDHGIADIYPEWLKNGKLEKNNAVWVSAQLIKYAFNAEKWENVEKFLDTEVFPLSDPQATPQPGDRECFEGT